MVGTCSTHVEKRSVYRVLIRRPEGKRQLERPRRKWLNNIEVDHRDL
jgi:hypothetical protein